MEKTPTHTDSKMETTEPELPPDFHTIYPDYLHPFSSFIMPSLTAFYEQPPIITIRETRDDPNNELSSMKRFCDGLRRIILEGLKIYGPEERRIERPDLSSDAHRFYHLFWKVKTYMEPLDNIVGIEEQRDIVIQRRIYLIELLAEKMRKDECSLRELGLDLDNIWPIGNVLATIPEGINKRLQEHLEPEEFWKTDFEKEWINPATSSSSS